MKEIQAQLPKENKKLRILDVGCGAGFFTILLAKAGHQVTGIDLTPDMIKNAKQLAEEEQAECEFAVMDAENPEFPDGTFDVIVSRNLTWTLPHVKHAYGEWLRVLKKGGVLLNFDANYGITDFSNVEDLPENHAHNMLGNEMMRECEEIKRQLPISSYSRPATYASRCIENEILMYLRRNSKTRMEVSIDEPLNVDWDGNELLLSDILGTDDDVISRKLEDEVEITLLGKAINKLSPREQTIIRLRFGLNNADGKEKTQKEVADLLGISQSYISRLEKRIMKRLKKEIVKYE